MAPKFKMPHTLTLLFVLMVLALVATWVVPQGQFQTEVTPDGRTLVQAGTYEVSEDRELLSPWELFTAVPRAFADAQNIIFFLFIVGGVVAIIRASGAIDALLGGLLRVAGGRPGLLMFAVIFVFACTSSAMGASAEYIPFVLILVALCRAMGMDAMVAVGMVVAGYGIGYGMASFNPYTVVIAQEIAEVPTYSGWLWKGLLLVPFVLIGVHHVWSYARKVQRDPSASLMAGIEPPDTAQAGDGRVAGAGGAPASAGAAVVAGGGPLAGDGAAGEGDAAADSGAAAGDAHEGTAAEASNGRAAGSGAVPGAGDGAAAGSGGAPPLHDYPAMNPRHVAILAGFLGALGLAVYGISEWGWYLTELGAAFLVLGLGAAVVGRVGVQRTAGQFVKGASELTETALLVGVARGIALIMEDGQILHTIVHGLSVPLQTLRPELAAVGMFGIQSVLNFFVPSGSGQAFVTMPLMAPLGDILELSRHVSVLAFQFGDGFANMLVPTNAVLMGILGMAAIPYDRWFRFCFPLFLKLFVAASLVLVAAVFLIPLGG